MLSELNELLLAASCAVFAFSVQAEARSGWASAMPGLAPLTPEPRWRRQLQVAVAAMVLALLLMPWAPDVAAVPFVGAIVCLAWRPLREWPRTMRRLLGAPSPAGPPYQPAIGVGVATAVQALAVVSLFATAVLLIV
jgi:hypothetical protein